MGRFVTSAAAVFLIAVAPAVAGPPDLCGVWYFNGDPNCPCRIDTQLDPRAPLVFTNEHGDQSPGALDFRGVVHAYTWGPTGAGLCARLTPGAIYWDNGSVWSRAPTVPVRSWCPDPPDWRYQPRRPWRR
jgi:hypothetical protein